MVGRDVELQIKKKKAQTGEVVLDVQNLEVLNPQNQVAVDGVSLQVKAGEVLGIAGVQGNGQTELVRALTGLLKPVDGKITILGQETTDASPRQITELGSAHIPEDRQKDGLVLSFPVADNLVLNTYYQPPFAQGLIAQHDKVIENSVNLVEKFDIRTPSVTTTVSALSGGNQQKVIVAREFSRPIKLLIASQPTRGLDVGSIEYIHKRLIDKRDEGTAILLVSTELDEVIQLSDRIAVMYRGKIIDTLDGANANKEILGLLMAGIHPDEETYARAKSKKEQIVLT
jgi:simple sugar transport system ATP-binding protein